MSCCDYNRIANVQRAVRILHKCTNPNVKKEARFLLKYGADSEGYQDSNKFMQQVKQAVKIAEFKYPSEHYNPFFKPGTRRPQAGARLVS